MASDPTYYELLGVAETAETGEIKTAFRRQVMHNHPDHGGNPALFRMIEDAYETLINPARREEYDMYLRSGMGTPPGGYHFAASTFQDREPRDESAPEPEYHEPTTTHARVFNRPVNQAWMPQSGGWPQWLPPKPVMWRVALFAFVVWLLIATIAGISAVPGMGNFNVLAILVGAMLFWVFGSFAFRISGWIIFLYAFQDAYMHDASVGTTVGRIALAVGLWLFGQWFFAFKHGEWRSVVAHNLSNRLPRPLQADARFH